MSKLFKDFLKDLTDNGFPNIPERWVEILKNVSFVNTDSKNDHVICVAKSSVVLVFTRPEENDPNIVDGQCSFYRVFIEELFQLCENKAFEYGSAKDISIVVLTSELTNKLLDSVVYTIRKILIGESPYKECLNNTDIGDTLGTKLIKLHIQFGLLYTTKDQKQLTLYPVVSLSHWEKEDVESPFFQFVKKIEVIQ